MQFHRGGFLLGTHANVQRLHGHRKRHGEVDIAFRIALWEPFGHQRTADEHEETQGQHFQRRMFVDEITDRAGKKQHEHQAQRMTAAISSPEIARHADGSDDRVQLKRQYRAAKFERNDRNEFGSNTTGGFAVFAFRACDGSRWCSSKAGTSRPE